MREYKNMIVIIAHKGQAHVMCGSQHKNINLLTQLKTQKLIIYG